MIKLLNDMKLLLRFSRNLRNYRKETALAIFAIFGSMIAGAISPLLFKWIIDKGIAQKNINSLIYIVIFLVVIMVAQEGFSLLQKIMLSKVREGAFSELRFDIYQHLQEMPMSFFAKNQSGNLLSRVISDVDGVQNLLTENLLNLLKNFILTVIITVILFCLSWKLSLAALLLTPLFFWLYSRFVKSVYNASLQVQQKQETLMGSLQENLSGVRVLQAYDIEKQAMKKTYENIRESERSKNRLYIRSALASSSSIGITVAGIVVLWGYGGYLVMTDEMTLGGLIAVSYYFNNLMGLFNGIFNQMLSFQASFPSAERINEILNIVPDIRNDIDSIDIKDFSGEISFLGVSFGYEKDKTVFENINLNITPKSVTGIIGASGEGKTTLVNLIARFYDPTCGEIKFDGLNIKKIKLESIRKNVVIVPQETFLFNTTIMENIRMGRQDIAIKDVVEAAISSKAHSFIEELPEGYGTMVGERGAKLSGGQKKRIAIARALVTHPKVIIFDEVTADLDGENEKAILSLIRELSKDKTVLMITHKLDTLVYADCILKIKAGIVERMENSTDAILSI
jgi:ABC-type multidrug transport system fused ATPase/permease subunit